VSSQEPVFELKTYYNVGRTDQLIKNISALKPVKYKLVLIGKSLYSNDLGYMKNTIHYKNFLTSSDWIEKTKLIPISVNPCVYETNGFAVQESLQLGKVTVVQEGSGGNTQHIVHNENGLIVDFNGDYESILDSLSIVSLKRLADNAKQTIPGSLYRNSISTYVQELI
jgi:glycosyltransferase involved in cell wall biosynthesis